MVRITYHTLSKMILKEAASENQAEMLHPGIAMVNRYSS